MSIDLSGVHIRPEGDEDAATFGPYFEKEVLKSIDINNRYDVLCNDGKNYKVEIKELDVEKNFIHLHFVSWANKYDYKGELEALYLAKERTYSRNSTKKDTTTTSVKNEKVVQRYPEGFLEKPRPAIPTTASRKRKLGKSDNLTNLGNNVERDGKELDDEATEGLLDSHLEANVSNSDFANQTQATTNHTGDDNDGNQGKSVDIGDTLSTDKPKKRRIKKPNLDITESKVEVDLKNLSATTPSASQSNEAMDKKVRKKRVKQETKAISSPLAPSETILNGANKSEYSTLQPLGLALNESSLYNANGMGQDRPQHHPDHQPYNSQSYSMDSIQGMNRFANVFQDEMIKNNQYDSRSGQTASNMKGMSHADGLPYPYSTNANKMASTSRSWVPDPQFVSMAHQLNQRNPNNLSMNMVNPSNYPFDARQNLPGSMNLKVDKTQPSQMYQKMNDRTSGPMIPKAVGGSYQVNGPVLNRDGGGMYNPNNNYPFLIPNNIQSNNNNNNLIRKPKPILNMSSYALPKLEREVFERSKMPPRPPSAYLDPYEEIRNEFKIESIIHQTERALELFRSVKNEVKHEQEMAASQKNSKKAKESKRKNSEFNEKMSILLTTMKEVGEVIKIVLDNERKEIKTVQTTNGDSNFSNNSNSKMDDGSLRDGNLTTGLQNENMGTLSNDNFGTYRIDSAADNHANLI